MSRRDKEPDEAFGPAVDGLEDLEAGILPFADSAGALPETEAGPEDAEPLEDEQAGIVLFCGAGEVAGAAAELAERCGFHVEVAEKDAEAGSEEFFAEGTTIHIVPDYQDIVEECGIDRDFYVCIMTEEAEDAEKILVQCLQSHAAYLGLWATIAQRGEIFRKLRSFGVPDAELAAVSCPMGINIGAKSADECAVSIVAGLMAARAGTLNRLRHED